MHSFSDTSNGMAQLQDDGQYVADEYVAMDFEDDADDQLQAARDRNSLDSDSDDDIDVVSRQYLGIGSFAWVLV